MTEQSEERRMSLRMEGRGICSQSVLWAIRGCGVPDSEHNPGHGAGRVLKSHFAEQLDQAAVLCPGTAHRRLNLSSCKTLVVFSFQTANSLRKVKTLDVAVSINSEFLVILAFGGRSLSASQLTCQMPSTPGRDSG